PAPRGWPGVPPAGRFSGASRRSAGPSATSAADRAATGELPSPANDNGPRRRRAPPRTRRHPPVAAAATAFRIAETRNRAQHAPPPGPQVAGAAPLAAWTRSPASPQAAPATPRDDTRAADPPDRWRPRTRGTEPGTAR